MKFLKVLWILFLANLHTLLLATPLQEEPEVYVLLSHFGAIYKVELHTKQLDRINVNVASPSGLDYDHRDEMVYFTDVSTKQIRRCKMNGSNDEEVAVFDSNSMPQRLTLDDETREIFYTDSGNNLIGKVNMDTFNHTVIVNTGLDTPTGIVADTKTKKLFWIDYGQSHRIETSDYNGDQRSVLVTLEISHPWDITLDEMVERLYWTNTHNEIESIRVDGTDRKTIFQPHYKRLSYISFYNDFLYYTEFDDTSIFVHPLNTGRYIYLSSVSLRRPKGLHVFSPNFVITERCPNGRFGKRCIPCGNCGKDFLCEKTTGVCLHGCEEGYRTLYCNESYYIPTSSTTSTPTSPLISSLLSSTPTAPNPSPSREQTLPQWAWILIDICIAVFCAIFVVICCICICKLRGKKNTEEQDRSVNQPVHHVTGSMNRTAQVNLPCGQDDSNHSTSAGFTNPGYEPELPSKVSLGGTPTTGQSVQVNVSSGQVDYDNSLSPGILNPVCGPQPPQYSSVDEVADYAKNNDSPPSYDNSLAGQETLNRL